MSPSCSPLRPAQICTPAAPFSLLTALFPSSFVLPSSEQVPPSTPQAASFPTLFMFSLLRLSHLFLLMFFFLLSLLEIHNGRQCLPLFLLAAHLPFLHHQLLPLLLKGGHRYQHSPQGQQFHSVLPLIPLWAKCICWQKEASLSALVCQWAAQH